MARGRGERRDSRFLPPAPRWAWAALIAGVVAIAVLLPFALDREPSPAGVAAATNGTSSSAAPTSPPALRLTAVGDSITEADSPDVAARRIGDGSWLSYAVGDGLEFSGGWADAGATTERMAAEVQPVTGDVLVVLAGTNDVLGNIPFEESAANLRTVVETVRTPRVIVSSIPPLDHDPGGAVAYNQQLQRLAAESGWEWVDAAAGLRDGDEYIATLTEDGIHPSAEGARLIGEAIAAGVQAGAEQPAA